MSRIVTDPFSGRRGAGSFCVETESDIDWAARVWGGGASNRSYTSKFIGKVDFADE
jgi:hypothetical protein